VNGFLVAHPLALLVLPVVALALGYAASPLWAWTLFGMAVGIGLGFPPGVLVALGTVFAVFLIRPIRVAAVSGPIMRLMKALKFLPVISKTEREALEAGTVWADGELFSGVPNFKKLLDEPYPGLNEEEQAFLDGPVEKVCAMTDDWDVWQRRDLSAEVWKYLKKKGFFGLIIPKEHGGKGFSASANSAIVSKLSSRSTTLAITVMVPNSLGPAELLHHYGTDEQKEHYLPRLADGRDIPAFALTEPNAGSDAGSITASGEVFKDKKGALKIRLDWNKRYITLAAISTLLGMAFKLRDPKGLLGKGEDLGITCALIPTKTKGVQLGMRHDPLGVPFYNCPTQGKDVVVSIDAIIGGINGIGRGWLMLMECLAAGRGISLPASAIAGTKSAARIAGAYAAVRRQFGLPIGKFEGIQEPLARIGGFSYLSEAARRYTCGALDSGAKPAVVTAMMKLNTTELCRTAINDAMDIVGGAGISRGPRNLLGHAYIGMPISITVEGANILTRTLVIFGQGAIRCHPFAYDEVNAVETNNVGAFDTAFCGHIGHVVRNTSRAFVHGLTAGKFAASPVSGPAARYYKKLGWASAQFAIVADLSMALLGGDLKRREAVTGRFADAFSWLYLGHAVLRRFEAEGRLKEDEAFMHWSAQYSLARIQEAFDGLFANLNLPLVGWLLSGPVAWWTRMVPMGREPSDALGAKVAMALQVPGEQRERMANGLYVPDDVNEAMGRLEHAFVLSHEADAIAVKIKAAIKAKRLPRAKPLTLVDEAESASIITTAEADLVRRAEAARNDAIQVDSFTLDEYLNTSNDGYSMAG
jgi:acyl-CoA dehydrogenase